MKNTLFKISKSLYTLIATLLFIYSMTYNAIAAKIILSPTTVNTTVGATFTINVDIDPTGENIYTVKNEIHFSPDIISVDTWNYGADWTALRQPEYDKFDNNTGVIIRTAGMPNGVPSRQRFGTLVFKAKKAGKANITVNGQSFALNADGKDVYSNGNVTTINISDEDTNIVKPKVKDNTIKVKDIKPETKSIIDLQYSASLINPTLSYHDTAIVVTKLNNSNKSPISVTVRSVLYDVNGAPIVNKEDTVIAVTQSDIVQQIPTDAISAGRYYIVNEIVYEGQTTPQKTTLDFNMNGELQPIKVKDDIYTTLQTSPIAWVISTLLVLLGVLLGLAVKSNNKSKLKKSNR